MKQITITLDDNNVNISHVPISAFAEMVQHELRKRGIIRTAVQSTIQGPFKTASVEAGKYNWFDGKEYYRDMGGKKGSGYILISVSLVSEYADFLAGSARVKDE